MAGAGAGLAVAGLLSSAEATAVRSALGLLRVHTCTITASEATGGTDAWGNPVVADDTPQTAVPCKYRADDRVRIDAQGNLILRAPTVTVAHDVTVAAGDRVSAITDSDGTVLLAGPAIVETIVPTAGLGPSLKKRLVLRGAVAVA